jgi:hypothetical protein
LKAITGDSGGSASGQVRAPGERAGTVPIERASRNVAATATAASPGARRQHACRMPPATRDPVHTRGKCISGGDDELESDAAMLRCAV